MHDEWRWQAVLARDPGQDGRFVYAVRTTGVDCQPTCRTRRPFRSSVEFFARTLSPRRGGRRDAARLPMPAVQSNPERLIPVALPCDWAAQLSFLRSRATPGVEAVGDHAYCRTVSRACLRVRMEGLPAGSAAEVSRSVEQLFGVSIRTDAVEEAPRREPLLEKLVQKRPGLRVPGGWAPLEVAVRAVVGHQISVRAATTIMERIVARAGRELPVPTAGLQTAVGLPAARIRTVRGVAAVLSEHGGVHRDTEQVDLIDRLRSVPGIGPRTVGYIAMRAARCQDAWPQGDLVLRRMAAPGGPPLSTSALSAVAERWRPYRAWATIHLWAEAAARTGAPHNARNDD